MIYKTFVKHMLLFILGACFFIVHTLLMSQVHVSCMLVSMYLIFETLLYNHNEICFLFSYCFSFHQINLLNIHETMRLFCFLLLIFLLCLLQSQHKVCVSVYKVFNSNNLMLFDHIYLCRSSCLEVLCKTGVFRNVAKFTGKHLCQSLFF